MRQLSACTLVLLFVANVANAASVNWLSDSRYLDVLSNLGADSASPEFGTTTWDTTISAGNAYATQNSTIDTSSQFGGVGEVFFDGVTDFHSASLLDVDFRVEGGGTTLVLAGSYGGYGATLEEDGFSTPGGSVSFELKQGDTVIYQAAGGVIDYSDSLADGDYSIRINASVGGAGFNWGGADFDYSGEFGTSEVAFVPIPAAAWLFGSALAGLGWLRRKQTV